MEEIKKINDLLRKSLPHRKVKPRVLKGTNAFIRVTKIILNDDHEEQSIYRELYKRTGQIISSVKQLDEPISFYLIGSKHTREMALVYSNPKGGMGEALEGAYPCINQTPYKIEDEVLESLHTHALITGIPNLKEDKEQEQKEGLDFDLILSTMRARNFILKVTFSPMEDRKIDMKYEDLLKERSELSRAIDEDFSESRTANESSAYQHGTAINNNEGAAFFVSKQEGSSKNEGETYTSGTSNTETTGGKKTNYYSKQYDELLENHIQRLEEMRREGGFITTIEIFGEDKEGLSLLQRALSAGISSPLIEPLHIHQLEGRLSPLDSIKGEEAQGDRHLLYGKDLHCMNLYTRNELAYFMTPHVQNTNGFSIKKEPRFLQQVSKEGSILIGNLLDYERDTGNQLKISEYDINKHILVAGMTGTGKTNTIFSILRSVDKPFLIIEPAKTEYRVLGGLVNNLRVYTLGREHISPFRINPFKFDYTKVALQEHIDSLKVIFTAAFTMYASMPNILEQCLLNIYTKKGWSLLSSKNILCDGAVPDYFYPTIEDLYVEIDHYIDALGYAQEQNQNIRAALLTRIKSLMTGSKGFMLNTHESMEIKELLAYPTVLELEGIADDTEKALMIGFIMLNIYEYLKANLEGYAGGLQHIVVMEEAHRLFANIPNNENQEQANMRGKAVETLSNMLCEIRAYGEGFIIVDQVPTKLATDVLKNTNTKIIHKLVSKDDCEYIQSAIQLKSKNVDFISRLKVGQALVYNEKLEETAHVKINFNKDQYTYLSNKELRGLSAAYNKHIFDSIVAHPIVETLFNEPEVQEKVVDLVGQYFNRILQQHACELVNSYNEIKGQCMRMAIEKGFALQEGYDEFVYELVKRGIGIRLNKSKYVHNLKCKYQCIGLISCAMKLGMLQEALTDKQVQAFQVAKSDIDICL